VITYKLKIKNDINVSEYCENYSYMFRKLYVNFELSQDKSFQKELRERYNLDSWIYESCRMDVETKLAQQETRDLKMGVALEVLQKELDENEFVGIKGKMRRYRVLKKITAIQKAIGKPIVFGGKALLKRISFLSNDKEANDEELVHLKAEYREKRNLPFYSVGEAPQQSNRKFSFDFTNRQVVFKPKKGIKIPIDFHCSKGQHRQLSELQDMIGELPISVRLNNEYLWLTFDEERLAGFSFDKRAYFNELREIPKEDKITRKDCYKKWIREQEARKMEGKNPDRYISFDLNPEHIGVAVLQKQGDTDFKVIFKECISLTGLNTRMRLSSSDPKQVKQNNKRIHELCQIWKRVFNLAKHYQVAHCTVEQLHFKEKGVNDSAKEANRKTRNLWHRERTTTVINKYCNMMGIELIEVNPCYSSFIGNIKHTYFDPINSAIEVGRRGIVKYLKGSFYPVIERSDIHTMRQFGLDVKYKTVSSWVEAFKLFKTAGLRYRRELKDFVEINLQSHKSGTVSYQFV